MQNIKKYKISKIQDIKKIQDEFLEQFEYQQKDEFQEDEFQEDVFQEDVFQEDVFQNEFQKIDVFQNEFQEIDEFEFMEMQNKKNKKNKKNKSTKNKNQVENTVSEVVSEAIVEDAHNNKSDKMSKSTDLQVRRPNKLYELPLKKNLALLFDILMYNFYVLNPKDKEFKMSWIELQKNFQINTANKNHIKEKLQELQELNLISDLKTWNYGFYYKFEKTFLSYEEILAPKTWTFLNYSLMVKLDFISYVLYTLAYKFFNFTKESHHKFENQTKFLDTIDFLKTFSQSQSLTNGVAQNRLLKRVRESLVILREFGILIEIQTKTFGKPIIGIKFLFRKVPKLKPIITKNVDFTIQRKKRALKGVSINAENWKAYSQKKHLNDLNDAYKNTEDLTIRNFILEDLFPAVVRSKMDFIQETRMWVIKKFKDEKTGKYNITTEEARKVLEQYKSRGSFEKMIGRGIFDKKTKYLKMDIKADGTEFYIFGQHPLMSKIRTTYQILL